MCEFGTKDITSINTTYELDIDLRINDGNISLISVLVIVFTASVYTIFLKMIIYVDDFFVLDYLENQLGFEDVINHRETLVK